MEKPIIEVHDLILDKRKFELKSDIARWERLKQYEETLEELMKELRKRIDDGKAGTPDVQRIITNVRAIEDFMDQKKKEIVNSDTDYKRLVAYLKSKYPEDLKRMKIRIEGNLTHKGIIVK